MDNKGRINLYTYSRKDNPCRIIEVGIYYSLGGMNYFTLNNETRGYFLDVQPLERDGHWTRMSAFSGTKMLIKEATRFNRKALERLAQDVIQDTSGEYADRISLVMEHVLTKNQINLDDYQLKQEFTYEPAR